MVKFPMFDRDRTVGVYGLRPNYRIVSCSSNILDGDLGGHGTSPETAL